MRKYLYKIAIPVPMFLLPVTLYAAAPSPASGGHTMNVALISLVSLIVVLLFAIGLLGNVLRLLASVYGEKMRAKKNAATGTRTLLTFLLLFPLSLVHAQEAVRETASAAPAAIAGMAAFDFYLLIGIIALEVLVILAMLATMAVMVRLLSSKPEIAAKVKAITPKPFWDRFNKAVAIEKEQDILLDHDYDGIQELDNNLPPWWKYGFYLTIIVAVVYLYYYHMGGNGPDQLQELAMEMERGAEEKATYLAQAANNIDENNVAMADAAGIASGQTLFQNMCAACHAKDGGGGVGPNLADAYWLHGGSLQDIFKSVKYGWPDKGMKSWKEDFSPRQIAEIASFVTSLRGTTPAAPKEKQGELYAANPTAGAAVADSKAPVADTLSRK
ncbi:MAG TPA: cbb3-type cytochrome c oxidase N-terminal domain-containing protein [Flavipsychrobacter sp.]|nr:cbb3-type cytochrome c oxidase N-terminal domain-containing protein [Flavipsychrobacter sp.]